ncbi:MAG: substrate-binding domain-containing protein [Candidatus Nanopelagicales bacterium]
MSNRLTRGRGLAAVAVTAVLALALGACSSGSSSSSSAPAEPPAGEAIAVSLITKNNTNPFFVAMAEGAKKAAEANGIDLTLAAGKDDTDVQGQIAAIENAVAQGQKGILITPAGPGVNDAITAAREAGLLVIALDTPTDPANIVDITFATDNFVAGQAIGQWTAGKLNGAKAVIARLIITDQDVLTVDYARDNGFLDGMGIDIADPKVIGDEATAGQYTTGAGGEYEIACVVATGANEAGGQKGMEDCLAKNPEINVVYTINEPTALGAATALKAAGKTPGTDVQIVSVDGGKSGAQAVQDGTIGATSQQYPLKMAEQGVKAIFDLVTSGTMPAVTEGKEFFDTGVVLCTNEPQDTVTPTEQEDAQFCIDNAWG